KAAEIQDMVTNGFEEAKSRVEDAIDQRRQGARDVVDAGKAAVHTARDELEKRLADARAARHRPRRAERDEPEAKASPRVKTNRRALGWAYSPLGFLRRIVVSIYENQVMFLASALAFDALLAALPFCVLVLAALGYVLHSMGSSIGDVHAVLDRFFPAHR